MMTIFSEQKVWQVLTNVTEQWENNELTKDCTKGSQLWPTKVTPKKKWITKMNDQTIYNMY